MEPFPTIDLDEGWETVQRGIDKIVSFVDADGLNPDRNKFRPTGGDYMNICMIIYQLCAFHQNRSINQLELYNRYKTFCQQYVHTKVLPALRGKNRELLLREVVKRWCDYKIVTRSVSIFFFHLEEYFIRRQSYPTLHDTALLVLQQQVYDEMKEQIITAVLTLIHEDRDGYTSDRALIKKVLGTVYDLESQTFGASYQIDFEPALLSSSCAYYLLKFKNASQTLSSEEYMSQCTECLNAERSRAEQCLYPRTMNKLLEVLQANLRCLGHRVEQLERGTSNLVRAIEELKIKDIC